MSKNVFPIVFIDPPETIDIAVTNIPAAASPTLEVIARMKYDATKLIVIDGLERFVGVYTGTVGNEVLVAVVGAGIPTEIPVTITGNPRISVRSMDSEVIDGGGLCFQFIFEEEKAKG